MTEPAAPTVPAAVPAASTEKPKRTHSLLAVIDYEGSGLVTEPQALASEGGDNHGNRYYSKVGPEPSCILEVGMLLLDFATLEEKYRAEWLVLPPGVTSVGAFDAWAANLRETNRYVYDMHSTPDDRGLSLLEALRRAAAMETFERDAFSVAKTEERLIEAIIGYSPMLQQRMRGTDTELWQTLEEALSRTHPGNSDVMFAGNSIANYDIPLMKLWMPRLHKLLSYRIMDVSVLRTFYVETCGLGEKLPPGLAESIASGGGGHRALSDALYCADALRKLRGYAVGAAR